MTVDVGGARLQKVGERGRTSLQVTVDAVSTEVWFTAPRAHPMRPSGDLMAAVGLIPAMTAGEDLRLEAAPSARLREGIDELQDVLTSWYPDLLSPIRIQAPRRTRRPRRVSGPTVTCFTGGVDSSYTLLTRRSEIDALVFAHGYDIPLSDEVRRAAVSEHLAAVAAEVGLPLIEIESNIRELLDPIADWGLVAHGPALAMLGLGLQRDFRRFLIPSTHSYRDSAPWGSHPLLDRSWSSDRLRVTHDGAGVSRVAKIRRIATAPIVVRHLRVCWQAGAVYNCGVCEKCVRTMITLSLCGELARCETFPRELDLAVVAGLTLRNDSDLLFLRENLELANTVEGSDDLRAALVAVERRYLGSTGDVT